MNGKNIFFVIFVGFLFLLQTAYCSPFTLSNSNSNGMSKYDNRTEFSMFEAFLMSGMVIGFNGTWLSDTEIMYRSLKYDVYVYDMKQNRKRLLVKDDDIEDWSHGKYQFSSDNKKILFRYDTESVFRHSTIARYEVYDIETKTSYSIANKKKLSFCLWSPVGSDTLAYVLDNNVYVRLSNGKEIQLTKDGINGVIYNGIADWVYEEEVFGKSTALWFSPDGKKIAIAKFNDTNVDTFKFFTYGEPGALNTQYPTEVSLKYPKPGRNNPKVELKVINLDEIAKGWIDLKAPVQIVTTDHILRSVSWISQNFILATWHNRRQNVASIQKCDLFGNCHEITRLLEPNGWIIAGVPQCLSDGIHCLMTNWIGNWFQIWKLNTYTGQYSQNYLGELTVSELYGIKESTGDVFYQGAPADDPSLLHVYKNLECLSCNLQDPEEVPCTQAKAYFSKDFSYYALTCMGPTPYYTKIYDTQTNTELLEWELNEKTRKDLEKKLLPNYKYFTIPVENGFKATVKLVLPPEIDIDEIESYGVQKVEKKYPMIVSVYGGPNSVRVKNDFSIGWEGYLASTKKIIYAFIDGRGTGYKGKSNLFTLNNRLGTVEYEDTIAVTKYLQNIYPFIDSKRTGVWGWSYGGFVSAMVLAKDTNRVFKCGISVAPVTSWIYYDSIYTERFMGLPTPEDNLKNYEAAEVFKDLGNFEKHNFLIIHGSGDDNVHYQQSLMLIKALENKDILFDQMVYPDENHSIGNFFVHLYRSMERFWLENFDLHNDD